MVGKKAESISINVIIIAIIALLVLIVLMAIFGGQMGLWGKNLGEIQNQQCKDRGDLAAGTVIPTTEDCMEGYIVAYGKYKDVPNGFKCCVPTTP